jgi:pimeloyl-ACP methyl ester carboxylesterase
MNIQHQNGTANPSKSKGRGCLIWLGQILVSIIGLTLVGAIYESVAEAADAKAYLPPGQLVDVGDHRLHINCTGTGDPTVIIDAGLGDWSTIWAWVQPEVAKSTRVCTYDRAGYGWSDPGPLPRNAEQFAKELHTMLHNANIPGPYVLVGHSLGGLTMRVFTGMYPSEVAGVVLIDSMSPRQFEQSSADSLTRSDSQSHPFTIYPALARIGLVRLLAGPLGLVPHLPPEAEKAYLAGMSHPTYLQTYFGDESQALPASEKQAEAVKSFGDLPLIVLTATLNPFPGWQDLQKELLQLSSNSQQLFAESDHSIEFLKPDAAVDAILKMVELVRQSAQE